MSGSSSWLSSQRATSSSQSSGDWPTSLGKVPVRDKPKAMTGVHYSTSHFSGKKGIEDDTSNPCSYCKMIGSFKQARNRLPAKISVAGCFSYKEISHGSDSGPRHAQREKTQGNRGYSERSRHHTTRFIAVSPGRRGGRGWRHVRGQCQKESIGDGQDRWAVGAWRGQRSGSSGAGRTARRVLGTLRGQTGR